MTTPTAKKTVADPKKVVKAGPEPSRIFGAGYLYHYDADYKCFAQRLAEIGGRPDIYEVLGVQFNSEPESLTRFAAELGKPITLHSFEYCLGNVERPSKAALDRIQGHVKNANVAYIGEHIAVMGTGRDYIGGFLQPLGTDEQTKVIVENLKEAKKSSACPLIVENASQFYKQAGPVSLGQQLRDVAEGADVGLLLSLSNISISERFRPQDREKFLAEIPMERVRQLHVLCGNTEEEKMAGMEKTRHEHAWAMSMMRELAKESSLSLSSVIFELESGTPSLPEPEKLRDYMDEARSLFFSDSVASAA